MKPAIQYNPSMLFLLATLFLAIPIVVSGEPVGEIEVQPELDDIVVTATRLPRHLKDIAGTVSVITGEEIERQISSGLDDVVRYQPGISMDTAGRGGNQGFIIRGIGGNRVLTLIDGVRSSDIYSAGPSSYGKDSFEVDDLKAVEIIRGPASVLYGADAMGGAVVLRTKDPSDYLVDRKSFAGIRSSYNGADENLKLGMTGATTLGDLGLFAQYTNRQFQERDIAGSGNPNPQDGRSDGLVVKTVWDASENHVLKLTLDVMRKDIDYLLKTDLSSSVTESLAADETDRFRLSFNHVWQLPAGFADTIDTHLYGQRTDGLQHTTQQRRSYSFIDPALPVTYGGTEAIRVSEFEFNQKTFGLGSMLSKTLTLGSTEHAMVYGFNIDRTETERPRDRCETEVSTGATTCGIAAYPFAPPEEFPNKTFPDTDTKRLGIYVQDEISVGSSGFTIIPGIRFDRYEMNPSTDGLFDISSFGFEVAPFHENQVSVNLGAIYDITDATSFFAQYSEGFRPPSFDEANQAFVNYGFRYATVPNPELQPEMSTGVEVGIKSDLGNSFWSVVGFDNHYEEFIASEFVGSSNGISLFQDRNIGKARIYGAEASVAWSFADRWQAMGSVAYSRGQDQEAGVPLDSIEPLTGVVGLRYAAAGDRWGIESRVTLVDAKDRVSADDRVIAAGYGLVDLVGHYKISDTASLRIGLFNVTDRQHARWANIQGLGADDAESIALAQEPGFNIRASIALSF